MTIFFLCILKLLQWRKGKYDFFPLNKALSLRLDEDSSEIRLEKMAEQIAYISQRLKEEEAQKAKEIERKRDLEWEKKHKR